MSLTLLKRFSKETNDYVAVHTSCSRGTSATHFCGTFRMCTPLRQTLVRASLPKRYGIVPKILEFYSHINESSRFCLYLSIVLWILSTFYPILVIVSKFNKFTQVRLRVDEFLNVCQICAIILANIYNCFLYFINLQ